MNPLKLGALRAARSAGLFALARDSAWRRRRLLVLCYHGVSIDDEHEWDPELYVPADHLRRRLRLLRDGRFNVLPLGEALERLYRGDLPPRSVALTFDDGVHDFAARAVPLLREFGMPATVYLTTYYSEHQFPVFNGACDYVLWKGRARELDAAGLVDGGGRRLPLADPRARSSAWHAIVRHADAVGLSAAEKNTLLGSIAERLGVDLGAIVARRILHIMTPDEVRALPADLVDVQLHTHRHRVPLDRALFAREIEDNRQRIAAAAPPGREAPVHFCYPSGVYDPHFFPWLRELRVQSATTCVPGLASPASDRLLLPRFVDTALQPDVAFESWVTGAAALLPRRGARL